MPIGTQDFEYVLDNEFFKNIEGEDVQKGKVNVKADREADCGFF